MREREGERRGGREKEGGRESEKETGGGRCKERGEERGEIECGKARGKEGEREGKRRGRDGETEGERGKERLVWRRKEGGGYRERKSGERE